MWCSILLLCTRSCSKSCEYTVWLWCQKKEQESLGWSDFHQRLYCCSGSLVAPKYLRCCRCLHSYLTATDFWNFPSQDIDFWYWSCKGRQCLLNIKLNTCCKKCILVFLIRHGSGKRCADREILLVLKALCGSYLLVGFATSWYKKESPAHLSALFLMRQLSASELISGEEEMEFPKLAELI